MPKVEIKGLDKLKKDLKNLSEKKVKSITTSSLRAGIATFRNPIKARIPTDSGNLKSSIKIIKRRTRNKSIIRFTIEPKIYKNLNMGDTKAKGYRAKIDELRKSKQAGGWYAFMVEYGTVHQAARPFMRPVFDGNKTKVTESITKQMAKKIEKEAN